MKEVKLYDTTLRDGAQAEDISFSLEDKLRITQKLDELGIHYVEGGWPASNPKDLYYFKEVKKLNLKRTKVVAFGSTTRKGLHPSQDENIKQLLEAQTETVTLFGKSWDKHVLEALETTLDENIELIKNSVAYLKEKGKEVIYDAEHFFDGFKNNKDYALATLRAAEEAGADVLVLCDTNGGTLPYELVEIIRETKKFVKKPLGIHCHNDSGVAVANSLLAVKEGIVHVQGTINGYGERCGNADLCAIIPNLELKMEIKCLPEGNLRKLREISRFVSELANLAPDKRQPYVGESAFAHKAGVHVSAVLKSPSTYEHIDPSLVGNKRKVLVSDLSGESNIFAKAKELGIDLKKGDPSTRKILKRLKELEFMGYQFEAAEASFELLVKKELGLHKRFFELLGFRVIVSKDSDEEEPLSEATIRVRVGDKVEHTAALGNGPVNALDNALRKALEKFYPELKEVELVDYKVRVLEGTKGTAAVTRVLIESTDGTFKWSTVGVSENIIEASWRALVDSIDYKLLKEEERGKR